MSEAKKYDRSYKEQSVKPALKIGVKRAGEELKIPYGTLYGWVQAAKNGIYTDTTKTKKSQRTQKYPQYVMDMLGASRWTSTCLRCAASVPSSPCGWA